MATLGVLSVALLGAGDAYGEAVARAEQAVALAQGAPDVPEIVQLRAWMAPANARQIARLPGVTEPARRALQLVEKLYPERRAEPVLEARQIVAPGLSSEGRFREATVEYGALLRARVDCSGRRTTAWRACTAMHAAGVRSLPGRHDDALRLVAGADRHLANQGNATMRNSVRIALALAQFRAGRAGAHIGFLGATEGALSQPAGKDSPDLADLRLALRLAPGRARLDRGDAQGALGSLRQAGQFWTRFDPAGGDAARAHGQIALAQAVGAEPALAAQHTAAARARLAHSTRADDRLLLADLDRAGR